MKLNLGCGSDRMDGWTNVDQVDGPACDQVHNLEDIPWPWESDSIEEIMLKHVLEHLGQTPALYLDIMKELYRVCKRGARITIIVPHPRHDHFINDPTHVRPITPEGLQLFSKAANREWKQSGMSNTPLGEIIDVDFQIDSVNYVPDEPWRGQMMQKKIGTQELMDAARKYNNVITESHIVLRVMKSGT